MKNKLVYISNNNVSVILLLLYTSISIHCTCYIVCYWNKHYISNTYENNKQLTDKVIIVNIITISSVYTCIMSYYHREYPLKLNVK